MRLSTREIKEAVLPAKIRFQIDFSTEFPVKKLVEMENVRSKIVPTLKCFCSRKLFGSSRHHSCFSFVAAQRRKTIQRSIDLTIPIRDSVRFKKWNSLVGRFSFVNNRLNVRSIKEKLFFCAFQRIQKQSKIIDLMKRKQSIFSLLKHLFDAQLIRQIFEIMKKLFVKTRKLSCFFQ